MATGCPSGSVVVTQPAPAYQGAQLTVACPDAKSEEIVTNYSRNWAAQRAGAVRTVRYSGATPPPEADLWVIPAVELPRLADAGALRTLPDAYTGDRDASWMDVLPLFREQLLVWDRKRYGFPLLGEAPVCCYRTDLFKEAKLAPPQTWEQFADAAEHFRTRGPSLPPLPRDDAELEREFYTIAICHIRKAIPEGQNLEASPQAEVYAFHYDLDGTPRIDAPGFVAALKLMRDRFQPCRPKGSSGDSVAAFRDGQAVLCLTDATQIVAFQQSKAVRDKVGVCRMPGAGGRAEPNRVPYLGSGDLVTVVPQTAGNAEAAFALAAELCSRDTSRQIAIEPGGGPVRISQLDDARAWGVYQLDRDQTKALTDALRETLLHPNVRNPALRLRTPDQEAHRQVLIKALREVLEEQGDPAAALQAVAKRWQDLDAKDPEAHRAAYRLNLGLLPR